MRACVWVCARALERGDVVYFETKMIYNAIFKNKQQTWSSHNEFKALGKKEGAAAVWSLRTKRLYAFCISKTKTPLTFPPSWYCSHVPVKVEACRLQTRDSSASKKASAISQMDLTTFPQTFNITPVISAWHCNFFTLITVTGLESEANTNRAMKCERNVCRDWLANISDTLC